MVMTTKLAIIMLGPPGAGKGTQAQMISEALQFPHVSTGDMLREALRNQTELGKKSKSYMESGALVPDNLVDALVAERLDREDCNSGVILDGYPRSIPQADHMSSLVGNNGGRIMTVGIEVADEELIKRLSSRWTCPQCNKIYNAALDQRKVNGKCDECNTDLVQRKDDTAEVIKERLQVYHKTTLPLIQYYKNRGSYVEVDGDRAVGEIFKTIMTRMVH
jgi:adenylate kinase